MKDSIYLDYNATTPIRPEAAKLAYDIMLNVGNASSVHGFGRAARKHIEKSREQIAHIAGTSANYITFTGGATESNNAVLKTFRSTYPTGRILVSMIEHPAVRLTLPDVEYIPVTKDGLVDLKAFETMLDNGSPPVLISVMMVNNETGVIQPVAELAKMARSKHKDVHFHTDAVQAAGRIKIDFAGMHIDYMSLSAHKLGGPQGVGALITAPGAKTVKLLHGGGQEKSLRAGTENVAGIAAFGLACALAEEEMEHYQELSEWRDEMEDALIKTAPEAKIYGKNAPRVANTTAFCTPKITAQTQLLNLDLEKIAVSSGSACSSGAFKPSPILEAMGANIEEASSTLRISSGWATKHSDITCFIDSWEKIYKRLNKS